MSLREPRNCCPGAGRNFKALVDARCPLSESRLNRFQGHVRHRDFPIDWMTVPADHGRRALYHGFAGVLAEHTGRAEVIAALARVAVAAICQITGRRPSGLRKSLSGPPPGLRRTGSARIWGQARTPFANMQLIYRSAELSLGGNALRLAVAARVVTASLFRSFRLSFDSSQYDRKGFPPGAFGRVFGIINEHRALPRLDAA
jgi:hypothetical protein